MERSALWSVLFRLAILLATGGAVSGVVWAAPPDPEIVKEAKGHFKRGAAHFIAREYDAAIKEYEATYVLAPIPDVLFNLGQAHKMKGNREKAVEYYRRYLAADPSGAGSDEARLHLASLEKEIEQEHSPRRSSSQRKAPKPNPHPSRDLSEAPTLREGWSEHDVERSSPKPGIEEQPTSKQQRRRETTLDLVPANDTEMQPTAALPTGKSRAWVWAVIAGTVVIAAGAATVGIVIGTSDKDPVPTFGRVDAR